jgi:hypothetical protein
MCVWLVLPGPSNAQLLPIFLQLSPWWPRANLRMISDWLLLSTCWKVRADTDDHTANALANTSLGTHGHTAGMDASTLSRFEPNWAWSFRIPLGAWRCYGVMFWLHSRGLAPGVKPRVRVPTVDECRRVLILTGVQYQNDSCQIWNGHGRSVVLTD